VLSVFNEPVHNIVSIVGDNCNTNRNMAKLLGKWVVGCHSHQFNLAVHDMMNEYSRMISIVRKLMQNVSNPIPAAKLRGHTDLIAICSSNTR